MTDDFKNQKPDIKYPCKWSYRVIGLSHAPLRQAIELIAYGREFTLKHSNFSKGGKYHSFCLDVQVESQAQRDEIFAALSNHPDVKMVL